MTPDGPVVRTVVAVCTFRRPDLLSACLDALAAHKSAEPYQVLVVDNSPEASVRELVSAQRVVCVHEPGPGIARARNTALRWAIDHGMELVAFVDDDEVVQVGWLDSLVRLAEETGAEMISGVTTSVLPASTPSWLRTSPAYHLERHLTGTPLTEAATGNLLTRTTVFAARPESAWFQPELGLTGGSDTELTRRFVSEGVTLLWCDESVVVEAVPEARATWRWTVRRGARVAGIHSRLQLDGGVSPLRVGAGGVARIVAGTGAALLSAVRPGLRARGLWVLGRGVGMLGSVRGRQVREYARPGEDAGQEP